MSAAINTRKMGDYTRQLVAFAKQSPTGNVRTDADAVSFAQQVEYVYAETYDIQYPDLDMAEGRVVPIDRSVPAGAQTFTYYTYGGTGIAAVMNTYAANSIPTVGMFAKSTTGTCHDLTLSFSTNVSDLESAAMFGAPLQTTLADADKRGHMLKRDEIGWFGNPSLGLYGFLTHPNITQMVATTSWTSATYDQFLADVGNLVNASRNLSNRVERANVCIFPAKVETMLEGRLLSAANPNGDNFMTAIRKAFPYVTFESSIMLDSENHAGTDYATKNVAVAFERNPRKVALVIPKDYTLLPPQWSGLEMRTFTHSKTGGIKCPYPLSVTVMRGM